MSSSSRWFHKQLIRVVRFWQIFPSIVTQVGGGFRAVFYLLRLGFFDGFKGLKEYCRKIEDGEKNGLYKTILRVQFVDDEALLRLKSGGGPGYIIYAPDFVSESAGVGCLYRLCGHLRDLGFSSYITGSRLTNDPARAPLIGFDTAKKLASRGYIVIYPETVVGNPIGAGTVVRWVLNRPGLLGGERVYASGEKVFLYSDVFRKYVQNHVSGKLYMPTINEDIFFHDEKSVALNQRKLVLYYIGKSSWQDGYVDRKDAFEITRNYPRKEELGHVFRSARILYCFDNSTILAYEAALCGCSVVIVPDGTQDESDYRQLELGTDLFSWGQVSMSNLTAEDGISKLKERYEGVKKTYWDQLQDFVRITSG